MTKPPSDKASDVRKIPTDLVLPASFVAKMDELFAQMQGPGARADVLRAINSTPEELGAAAVKAARAKLVE